MKCVYGYTTVSYANEGPRYLERMDERGDVVPFFSDSTAYVTITDDGHYAISNVENEVFFVGKKGLKGASKQLMHFERVAVLINDMSRAKYEAKLKREQEVANGKENE